MFFRGLLRRNENRTIPRRRGPIILARFISGRVGSSFIRDDFRALVFGTRDYVSARESRGKIGLAQFCEEGEGGRGRGTFCLGGLKGGVMEADREREKNYSSRVFFFLFLFFFF